MSYYTNDELRDFEKYAKEYVGVMKKEEVNPEELKALNDLIAIIVTMYYNAMVFESYISGYAAHEYLLSKNLEELPLHISDEGLVSEVIVKWRLERGK